VPPKETANATRYGTQIRKNDKYGVECFSPVALVIDGVEYFFPYAAVSITNTKRIVTTPLVNRRGSVNELVSLGDYEISISGMIIDRENDIPEDGLEQIKTVYESQSPISIINPITDFYLEQDDKIIITRMSIPDMVGYQNAQAFSLQCKTDSVLTLELGG